MRFKLKKKKGSTLVEVIASVAILAIGLMGFKSLISTSSNIWEIEHKKLDTSTFNMTISQNIRKKEKLGVRNLYENRVNPTSAHFGYIFIYFDDYTDLVGTGVTTETDLRKKYGAVGYETDYTYINETNANFTKCKEGAGGKKYGALISIVDAQKTDSNKATAYYSIYKVTVKVWNLIDSGNFESETSFYVGG